MPHVYEMTHPVTTIEAISKSDMWFLSIVMCKLSNQIIIPCTQEKQPLKTDQVNIKLRKPPTREMRNDKYNVLICKKLHMMDRIPHLRHERICAYLERCVNLQCPVD